MTKPKSQFSLLYLTLTLVFCVCLIIANITEIKTVDLGPVTITAGVIVFPISYIINDCIVEVYGFKKARLTIWMGFGALLFVTLMLQLALALPGSKDWTGQEAMQAIYGGVPRIMIASFIAFICGSMVNAYVMSKMKRRDHKGNKFSARAIISTLFGEGIDSLVFFPIAFAGALPWDVVVSLIVCQTVIKTVYEILVLPVTLRIVNKVKRIEQLDTVDGEISYKWWRINEL